MSDTHNKRFAVAFTHLGAANNYVCVMDNCDTARNAQLHILLQQDVLTQVESTYPTLWHNLREMSEVDFKAFCNTMGVSISTPTEIT